MTCVCLSETIFQRVLPQLPMRVYSLRSPVRHRNVASRPSRSRVFDGCVGARKERLLSQPSFLFILGDDIGWAEISFPNNGTARSPNLRAWANAPGSIYLQDFHTGGTVCSPTRATVLTGRNHF